MATSGETPEALSTRSGAILRGGSSLLSHVKHGQSKATTTTTRRISNYMLIIGLKVIDIQGIRLGAKQERDRVHGGLAIMGDSWENNILEKNQNPRNP